MRAEGHLPDPRSAQIVRLKDDNVVLRKRLAAHEQEIADLSSFKTTALSRLAAQHTEISRLRAATSANSNIRALPPPAPAVPSPHSRPPEM